MDEKSLQLIKPVYTASAVRPDQYPKDDLPEVAFLGRSNVGKSSLINSLCNYRGLARVSGAPGKTQTINFYHAWLQEKHGTQEIRQPLFLVDLPGYGFAKTGGKKKQLWSRFIGEYIVSSPRLALLVLLVDLRHPGLPIDTRAYQWLVDNEVPLQIVGTKADKLNRSEQGRNLSILKKTFPTTFPPVPYSSLKREGISQLLQLIYEAITG